MKILDPDGRIEYMSCNGMCTMEIAAHSSNRRQGLVDALADLRSATGSRSLAPGPRRKTERFEADCPTGAGTMKRWSV